MTTPTISIFNTFVENLGNGSINIVDDVLMIMFTDSYTFSSSHEDLTDVSSYEITEENGYSSGGIILSNISFGYNETESNTLFDADNLSFIASGGSVGPITGAVLYSSENDKLIAYIDFDEEITLSDEQDLVIAFSSGGILVIE